MVGTVKSKIIATRNDGNEFDKVYGNMLGMAERAGMDTLDVPRICERQTQRNNVPARSPKEYFKLAVFIPYLDCLIQQLDLRFSDLTIQGLRALCLIPSHLFKDEEETIVADDLYKFYSDDLLFHNHFIKRLRFGKPCGIIPLLNQTLLSQP